METEPFDYILLPWELQANGAFEWWARRRRTGEIAALVQPLAGQSIISGKLMSVTLWTGDIRIPFTRNWTKLTGHANKQDALDETNAQLKLAGYKLLDKKMMVML